jgi:hypothetical protein
MHKLSSSVENLIILKHCPNINLYLNHYETKTAIAICRICDDHRL